MKDILQKLVSKAGDNNVIDNELYKIHNVKKGLRNEDGTGVLVGLTKISDVVGYKKEKDKKIDDYGSLYYRGINISEFINHQGESCCDLFEETAFLILFGYLPNSSELNAFKGYLSDNYDLPKRFLEHNILSIPGQNLINKLQQTILMLYNFDDDGDDTSPEALLEKGLNILAKLPAIICYIYQSKVNYYDSQDLIIKRADKKLTISENLLYMLRVGSPYTKKEVDLLDALLLVHADHGGGNNSTFINSVATSTLTDLYSSLVGGIGSMKGPRHGGANVAVSKMMTAVKDEIGLTTDRDKIRDILIRILNKDFFDKKGLVYGIGHAVYTKSDPRCEIIRSKCSELAPLNGFSEEFEFYKAFEEEAINLLSERKGINICSNVDFYSGFAYKMIGIPEELYTLLFILARTVGWVAHNVEYNQYADKIIRPATLYVGNKQEYIPRKDRC
ncbi:citrate synthase [Alloiococcus sp. CFN-8]|uniref:citrate synthase n=1 Tax=Alloiococcus sp. CFN-8 TaxID=3416081 RepID=UPI003CFAAA78